MSSIRLENMEFYSYIGCFDDEKIVGNPFIVNFEFNAETYIAGNEDCLEKTIDYSVVYGIIESEMSKKCNLVENVCVRILKAVCFAFPQIEHAVIEVAKLNPPIGGRLQSVKVRMSTDDIPK